MKRFKKDITGWLLICLCFIIILLVYNNRMENDLQEQELPETAENAPAPTALHPLIAEKTNELIEKAADKNIQVVITETIRTMEQQEALYAQGRTVEGDIVTYARTGESYHNYGLAVDFAIKDNEEDVTWDTSYDGNNNGKSDWMEVVDIAKELGFEWGGDWHGFKDYPHLQITFGLSIEQLQQGKRPDKADTMALKK